VGQAFELGGTGRGKEKLETRKQKLEIRKKKLLGGLGVPSTLNGSSALQRLETGKSPLLHSETPP